MPVEEPATIVLGVERGPVNRYVKPSSTHASVGTWVESFLTAILRYAPFFSTRAFSFILPWFPIGDAIIYKRLSHGFIFSYRPRKFLFEVEICKVKIPYESVNNKLDFQLILAQFWCSTMRRI